jgi:cation-transporting P-type ATPase E
MTTGTAEQGSQGKMHIPNLQGLTTSEVVFRRKQGLGNVAPLNTSRTYFQIVRENVFIPVNNFMFVLGIALLLLGQYTDALLSVGVVSFNILVSVVQEIRAKRTLDRIALLTRPKATVIREGKEQQVDPGELVIDDLLVVRPGDQIVVDGMVVGDSRMEVDESLLTGESDLISKRAGGTVYSGSFCVTGMACYQAVQVGAQTVANKLTVGARAFRRMYTPLQHDINVFIQAILLVALFFELLLVVDALFSHFILVQSVKMAVVIFGIVPKGLILAISLAYAMGAVRIIGKGALVQQANAVESLSNVDMICMDKTGTLTTNNMALDNIYALNIDEPELMHLLGIYAASLSVGNVTIEAIGETCKSQSMHVSEEVPFSSTRKWSALLFDDAVQGIYVLGAPDVLLTPQQTGIDIAALVNEETARGRRVLLFARSPSLAPLLDSEGEPHLPNELIPLGLVSLRNELRSQVLETLTSFSEAGIQLKIISGDHPKTVAALAKQVGLDPNEIKMVSGDDLTEMDMVQLAQIAEETTIFGRITPQQKESLIQALRSRDHYVAMIGDGVNDVLSLKQADLGIAMNSGSQATRSVADIILLGDSFESLPQVFLEGQRIRNGMQNILKLFLTRVLYMTILLVGTTIVDGFPLVPKQNAILTFMTEGIPTLGLATWTQPGLSPRSHLYRSFLHFIIPAATTLSLAGLGVFFAVLSLTSQLTAAQSALTTLAVVCGLLLIPFVVPPTNAWVGGNTLSGDWRPTIMALGLLVGYGVMLAIPPLGAIFEIRPLAIGVYVLIGVVSVIWALTLRWIWRKRLLERYLQVEWSK